MRASLRSLRRGAAAFQKRIRRAAVVAATAASLTIAGTPAPAQIGGMGMGAVPLSGGVVNRAVTRFSDLSQNGPGWMYFGLNPADRGLGYRGSYMTLGGYIPYAEDDLGGFWAADLRSHLSVYGGFFSNVGAVRKQFLGGTLLGIGVYWDYDGDQDQYSDTAITDASGKYVFPGGDSYNQVGISAEWLTDWGNLRSNGYIPVGSTASTMGPYVGNSILCVDGINAALRGADLEVGAYVPGLSDWAGMINVGGYAYGNSSYDLAGGEDVVPWFGGVYTRLDLTLRENWDFSIQYNNDSYFDSTGFIRLTYRMGGSRRRNVPDQMEQPMMRNEHIVRAHQAPEQAINPSNGDPWYIIHVDNSSGPSGTGTWQAPVQTLAEAQSLATNPYDIVFVHRGNSENEPYAGGFTFQADNQYLVGEGSDLTIPTVNCGMHSLWSSKISSSYPVISNPGGAAVVLSNGSASNTIVDHVKIVGSQVGISDGPGLPSGGVATIRDVQIVGNGPGQRGIAIRNLDGDDATVNIYDTTLQNLTNDGVFVSGAAGGNLNVNLNNATITDTSGSALVVNDVTAAGRVRLANSTLSGATGPLVQVINGNAIVSSSKLTNTGNYGIVVTGPNSTVQVNDSRITAAIGIQASAPNAGDVINLTATENTIDGINGISLASGTAAGTIRANIVGNSISVRPITSGTATLPGNDIVLGVSDAGSMSIRALNKENLAALNNNANILESGTTPIYDPALIVPLPTP
jgi:hypothetical protein